MLEMFRRQLAWSDWANRELLAALRRIERPPAPAVGRLAHVLAAEHLWLARLERRPQPMAVWPELALAEIAVLVEELPDLWRRYFERAGEAGLVTNVAYTNSKGESFSNRASDILLHLVAHGAYHRGQLAADLRAAGETPPYTDFIHWVRSAVPESGV
ncbi:MAG: DinB family protein [Acidobacteriota bacterium]